MDPTRNFKGGECSALDRRAYLFLDFATVVHPSVCDTVARLGQGKCTLVHDKVYATLGLNTPVAVPIDYSITLPELFYNVLLSSFRSSHDSVQGPQTITRSTLAAANIVREELRIPFSALEDHLSDANSDALLGLICVRRGHYLLKRRTKRALLSPWCAIIEPRYHGCHRTSQLRLHAPSMGRESLLGKI